MRLSARVCGGNFFSVSEASHFCASWLIVEGMGITRFICAAPSESKLAESVCDTELDCAAADKQSDVITPLTMPEANRGRVLINLHGGGFVSDSGSLIEGIPIANLAKIKV